MSDSTVPADGGQDPTPQDQDNKPDEPLREPGKKALESERAARAAAEKAAAELQAKLDEIEKANLSEVERAKREAQEAKAELERARSEATRARIQAKFAISDEDAELFLTATDEATLTKQAERLAQRAEDRKKNGNRAPLQGRTPSSVSGGKDQAKREWLRSMTDRD
jgi:hypothetical protein